MNYLVLPIGCQDRCVHSKIQANLLFILFNEMLITMYAGYHNVKWVYLNDAKQHYFWNEMTSLLVLLQISHCQICCSPRAHILLSCSPCCQIWWVLYWQLATLQKEFLSEPANLLWKKSITEEFTLCRNLKIFICNAHFVLFVSDEVSKLILMKSE